MSSKKPSEPVEIAATMAGTPAPASGIEVAATMMPDSASYEAVSTDGATMAQPLATGANTGVTAKGGGGAVMLADEAVRYEKSKVLGEGGMGQVWLVKDARIGRRVAMKQIRGQAAQGSVGLRDRFLREARVQGQLEHPSIVPVYDLGTNADGEIFFTMKRVRGVTLAEVIRGLRAGNPDFTERFSLRRLLTAFSQICLAIDFAHERGVVHRDLKPDNLMLGDHGEVYVLDWGVARVLRDDLDSDEAGALAASRVDAALPAGKTGLVGTPGYIAPEIVRGESVGVSVDVFALGAILFELVAHEPLLGVGSPMERMNRALEAVDVAALVAKAGRDVAPELVALCVKATLLDVAERTPSAMVLHQGVEGYLDGERDQALRNQLAERHLAASRAAVQRSSEDVEAHKLALRETGRALALVPDLPEAREIIFGLFASTPKAVPAEVTQAIEDGRAMHARTTAKGGAIGMASTLLFVPVLVLFGIRSWLGVGIFSLMCVVAAAISAVAARRQQRSDGLLYLVVVFNNITFSLASGMYGPMVMVPAMVITNTISFALHLDGRSRRLAVASACLAIVLPVVLPWFGILPHAYVPSGDGLLLRPLWVALPPAATLSFLTLGTLIAIVNGARAVAEVRDNLTAAERKLQLQRWQLAQLLPEERK